MRIVRLKALERALVDRDQAIHKARKQRDEVNRALAEAESRIAVLETQLASMTAQLESQRRNSDKEIRRLLELVETERKAAGEKLKQVVRKKKIRVTDL